MAFFLRKAGVHREQKFRLHAIRVDVLFLKPDRHAQLLECSNHLQTVGQVSYKPGDGLGEDQRHFSFPAVPQKPLQLRSNVCLGAGDADVDVAASKFPSGIRLDGFFKVNFLIVDGSLLGLHQAADAGVIRDLALLHLRDSSDGGWYGWYGHRLHCLNWFLYWLWRRCALQGIPKCVERVLRHPSVAAAVEGVR